MDLQRDHPAATDRRVGLGVVDRGHAVDADEAGPVALAGDAEQGELADQSSSRSVHFIQLVKEPITE